MYDWRSFSDDDTYQIPADVDAVLVVKDMAEHNTLYAIERLSAAGFHFTLSGPGRARHDAGVSAADRDPARLARVLTRRCLTGRSQPTRLPRTWSPEKA